MAKYMTPDEFYKEYGYDTSKEYSKYAAENKYASEYSKLAGQKRKAYGKSEGAKEDVQSQFYEQAQEDKATAATSGMGRSGISQGKALGTKREASSGLSEIESMLMGEVANIGEDVKATDVEKEQYEQDYYEERMATYANAAAQLYQIEMMKEAAARVSSAVGRATSGIESRVDTFMKILDGLNKPGGASGIDVTPSKSPYSYGPSYPQAPGQGGGGGTSYESRYGPY